MVTHPSASLCTCISMTSTFTSSNAAGASFMLITSVDVGCESSFLQLSISIVEHEIASRETNNDSFFINVLLKRGKFYATYIRIKITLRKGFGGQMLR